MIFILFLFSFLFFSCSDAAETIRGTVADQSTSFDFNINNPVLAIFKKNNAQASIIFTSAASVPSDASFTIAGFAGKEFIGWSSELLMVNGKAEQQNPLRGVATAHLTLFGSRLALIRTDKPAQLFVQDKIFDESKFMDVITTRDININDATGSAASAGVRALETDQDTFIFAAVAPNGGVFGGANSGIALVALDSQKEIIAGDPKQEKLFPFLDIVNGTNGQKGGNVAVRFDPTTAQLKIGTDLAAMADVVDMHWDAHLQRLYCVVTVTGGAAGTDGVRAVIVARLNESTLIFDAIAPDAVFAGTDKIIGATGSSVSVSLSKVATMHTTTGLSYLIVAGGNGLPATTGNSLFAVPLVDRSARSEEFNKDPLQGTLANSTVNPETFFKNGFFTARAFTTPAEGAADVLTTASVAARIGAGALPLIASGAISDLLVVRDTVFAAIKTDYDGGTTEPGLYASQAIFNEQGVISAWTAWQRVAGTDALMQGAILDPRSDSFTYLQTNAAGTVSNTMKQTVWSAGNDQSGSAGMATLFKDIFAQDDGGVQGLFDFARNTATFTGVAGDKLSLVVATGKEKITLVETARDEGLNFKPFFGSYAAATATFSDGAIGTTFTTGGATRALAVSGGAITDLGPISTANIATDGSEGFLALGGVGGLAVLATAGGAGWASLSSGFGGIVSGMQFFKAGAYRYVRSLIADGTNLYVLTNNTFDRIDMTTSNFATGVLAVETLATPLSMGLAAGDSFSDSAISQELGLLATSAGLFRVGNGHDVRTGTRASLNWTKIVIPNAPGPATRFGFATTTGKNTDFKTNSQIHLLAAYTGYNQAQLNRYYVNFSGAITDTTIQAVPDFIVASSTFLIAFGAFRNFLLDDGAFVVSTRSRNNLPIDDPFLDPVTGLTQEPKQKREAFVKLAANKRIAKEQIKVPFKIETTSNIANTIRSSASGAVLVPGDFGLKVND